VELVEVLVRDSVSTLRRGEDGKYPERASRYQEQSKFVDIYVPPHLYGQLAQHKDGLEVLLDSGDVHALIQIVNTQKCSNTEETRELKAALWALAHFATSADTVSMLEESRVLESMVELGRFCPVLSVRHTVFHCLCLVCVTSPGLDALAKWDWHGMPRNHHESYTIWSPELYTDAETRRLMRLRVEAELPEEEEQGGILLIYYLIN
jgi:rapamycin-insensitive companion of mTOR